MRGNPNLGLRGNPDLGFGHTSATMIVVGTPSQELALTNNAYCSASDLRKFVIHGSSSTLVLVGDSIVLSFFGHNNVADDRIALNAVQRRHIKVSAGDQISVISFFAPACFSLALLTLGLDYLNGRANINDELDAIDLAQHFRKKFNNQTWLIGGLIEINLPDENGRLQILQMHTNTMRENSFLAADVNLQEIAARTKNFTMAELEGVVRSAVSFALNRKISMDDLTKPLDEENIKVTMNDFLSALQEIIPAFGASTVDLQRCRVNGMVDCGETHKHIYERTMLFVKEVKLSRDHTIVSCLLEGPKGSGKTAMAATIGIDSDFPYAKIVSAESMIGLSESSKCAKIAKVFEDAYRSQLSIIILDDIERLLEYVPIGPHFSNLIVQTLLVLLKKLPPKGKNMLVIGTTSEVEFLKTIGICAAFSVCYHVPTLSKADFKKVLEGLNVFARDDIDAAAEALVGMPLKKLFSVVKMAARLRGNLEDIYSGEQKIDINCFYDILSEYMSIGH